MQPGGEGCRPGLWFVEEWSTVGQAGLLPSSLMTFGVFGDLRPCGPPPVSCLLSGRALPGGRLEGTPPALSRRRLQTKALTWQLSEKKEDGKVPQ
ncbi:hypothetical protein NDU88_006753 [Pleurodeles waltl]|uniref:Uncharacterized protein n=1 Tax=Pleurodeles waltl TaxID=8319 RepID=A0AAV7WDG7_PLEWA|nr:hypothetical protein NDU88_006753 [Pleurodeles waltl]